MGLDAERPARRCKIFGKNQIIGKKWFRDNAPENSLKVTSVFLTLQGEGPYSGRPAVFIRLSHCNLACSFCDTYFDDGEFYTVNELRIMVHKKINDFYIPKGKDDIPVGIVITGGEPMLQQEVLTSFVNEMSEDNIDFIQIETNGTVEPTDDFIDTGITIVVSPKCVEKNGKEVSYIKPSKNLLNYSHCLKFVLTSDTNSLYNKIPDWVDEYRGDVYISPINVYNTEPRNLKIGKMFGEDRDIETRSTEDEVISFWTTGLLNLEENKKNHEYAAKYCLDNGHILQLQVHLYAGLA